MASQPGEIINPKAYASVPEAIQILDAYFQFYNHQRLHQSLDYRECAARRRSLN